MSESDTSIAERSIISSLAATNSFSAVGFFAAGSLLDALISNSRPTTNAKTQSMIRKSAKRFSEKIKLKHNV